jgi:hypothetical protein
LSLYLSHMLLELVGTLEHDLFLCLWQSSIHNHNRDICKVTMSSSYLWASFRPQTPLSVVSAK